MSKARKPGDALATIYVRVDDRMMIFNRSVYKMQDLLEEIGGLSHVSVIIGSILVKIISVKLFHASILKNIFHVKKQIPES